MTALARERPATDSFATSLEHTALPPPSGLSLCFLSPLSFGGQLLHPCPALNCCFSVSETLLQPVPLWLSQEGWLCEQVINEEKQRKPSFCSCLFQAVCQVGVGVPELTGGEENCAFLCGLRCCIFSRFSLHMLCIHTLPVSLAAPGPAAFLGPQAERLQKPTA